MLWIGALVVGAALGMLGMAWLNGLMNFIATVYTRLFQLLAVPTIALAVMTTLALLGNQADTGKIFRHAITYTLLTTFAAAAVGLVLYNVIAPGNLPAALVQSGMADVPQNLGETSYYDHILGVIPNNIVKPFADGNVLSILMLAAAVGIALAKMPQNDKKEVVVKGLFGLQDLLFMLIHGLIWALPLGIVAFAAQLSAQFSAGIVMASLGKYVAVILGGNVIQFFIVLPLFLLARGINPSAPRPHDAGGIDGSIHQEFGCHAACHHADGRREDGSVEQGVTLRLAYLHHYQHEWLCGVHPRHLPVPDAERRNGAAADNDDSLALHLRAVGSGQCRSANGLLFPHPLADVGSECANRHHGYHPADIYHHRHDRDGRKRVV